jgi:NCS1 nucleoside transporter family
MTSETLVVPELEGGIETHGIEPVSPQARTHTHILDNCTMWLSTNLVVTTVALGALATNIFALGFWDSVLAIVLFNLLGALPVAFFAILGPKLGLRQMTISRFSFGWFGAKLMALVNVVACIGWCAVNVIVGGQLISELSHGTIPRQVGILVITMLTTLISIYGYRFIHRYERYAWMPMAIIFFIIVVAAGPHITIVPTPALTVAEFASFISFGGAIFGFAIGWSSFAADYSVKQPENTPSSRVFWLTFLGVTVPCILLEILGMALTSAYKGQMGSELLASAFQPLGSFGTVLLVLLSLSIVTNNVPNDYSLGLSMQVLGKSFQRLNRGVWTLIGAVLYVLIAVPAASNFNETLTNFLLIIAYWLGPWSIILILEHFVFRRGYYNVEDWNVPGKLPVGGAALISLAVGMGGVLLGAAQVYYVGPIARLINPPFGMDIGFELGVIFAGTAYLFLRWFEINMTRR